jgi:hypothetical protein
MRAASLGEASKRVTASASAAGSSTTRRSRPRTASIRSAPNLVETLLLKADLVIVPQARSVGYRQTFVIQHVGSCALQLSFISYTSKNIGQARQISVGK